MSELINVLNVEGVWKMNHCGYKKKEGRFTSRREGTGGRRVEVREAPLSCHS